jgi:hypothetical protein
LTSVTARVIAAFKSELQTLPVISLRGGDTLDDYGVAPAFDPDEDAPSDDYIERFHCGVNYLDAQAWRHYLPILLLYMLRNMGDQASLALPTVVRSLRPAGSDPSRFGWLSPAQEATVVTVLDALAFEDASTWKTEAVEALEDYWAPGANYPGTAAP